MTKAQLFIAIVVTSLLGLLISILAIIILIPQAPSYPYWMNEMMRGMMGDHFGETTGQPITAPFYVYMVPLTFTVLAIVGTIGLLYTFIHPEIKKVREEPKLSSPRVATQSVQAVMKTLKPDELKVLEILSSHEGRHLQKYISKEAGLSRLKTHRIVARFAERGIVSVREYGNTNEVILADWLLRDIKQDRNQ